MRQTDNSKDMLFNLLPGAIRGADRLQPGHPLQVLYRVLQSGYDDLEQQMGDLYAAWFIETCEPNVAPRIGELVGAQPTSGSPPPTYRAEVANTLSWRAQPGMLQTVAQAAASITGWPTAAVDVSAYMAASAAMNPAPGPTAGVRIPRHGTDGPGRPMTCAASFSLPTKGRARQGFGEYRNLNAVELQVWTLPIYAVEGATPSRSGQVFAFHPAGVQCPLYVSPQTFAPPSANPGLCDLPRQLTRSLLQEILASPALEQPLAIRYWGDGEWRAIAYDRMRVARLDPLRPAPHRYGAGMVLVDPERGLFAFSGMQAPPVDELRVDYVYGFGGAIGGGPYRSEGRTPQSADQVIRVASSAPAVTPSGWRTSIQAAFEAWDRTQPLQIELVDSGRFDAPPGIELPPGAKVTITALPGARPVVTGDLTFTAQNAKAGAKAGAAPQVILDGLHCLEGVSCQGASLTVEDCTLGLARPSAVRMEPRDAAVRLRLERSVVGPIACDAAWIDGGRTIFDSRTAPDGPRSAAFQGADGGRCPSNLDLRHCTVFGDMDLGQSPSLNDCAIDGLLHTPAERRFLRSPFMTRRWGHPYYMQLAYDRPKRADDGAFGSDGHARRLHDLEAAIARHLPQGLSCAVVLVT